MTKPTMTSQWDPGNYKPLDMSKIPGYPRKMPPFYKDWLPRFAGIDGESPDYHMSKFWEFFQYFPISDEAEDLVMKLFSASLHGGARRWYDNLPAASITSMDHFEEIFLAKWAMKMEDIQSLLKGLEGIKQTEPEIVRVFGARFQKLLYQIPQSHRPKDKYLVYLYTNGLQGHLSFLLNKKNPKTLAEAHNMAIRIEEHLSLSRTNDHTMDTLSLIKLVSLETFAEDPQERREQVFDQQDVVKEQEPKQDDEMPTPTPHSDEVIQEPVSPAQQSKDEVSCFPLQVSNDTLVLDSENEGEMKALNEMDVPCCAIKDEEAIHEDETIIYAENAKVLEVPAQEETVSCPPLLDFDDALLYDEGNEEEKNESNPACYDTDNDIVDNIDEFIHVGRRRWDIVGYDLDPIYDIDGPFQRLPLHLSPEVTNNFDIWQQEPDLIQKPKDDLVLCSPINFWSYLEDFDDYPSEHLDLSYEASYQPTLCLDVDKNEEVTFLKQDACDRIFHPPLITLPCYVTRGVVWKHVPYPKSPVRKNLILDFRGKLSASRRSLLSQFSNLPFRNGQSSFQFCYPRFLGITRRSCLEAHRS
jgi:hypothetical protein